MKQLKEDYTLLKFKIGRIPTMMDFVAYGSRDPYMYVEKSGSLYAFTEKVESSLPETLPNDLKELLAFYAQEVCNGIRIEEPFILSEIIAHESVSIDTLLSSIRHTFGIESKEASIQSAVRYINGKFHANCHAPESLIVNDGVISRSEAFTKFLSSDLFVYHLKDAIAYATYKFTSSCKASTYYDGLVLYNKYSRKDVCRVLNWMKDEHATMYGYRIKHNTCPIFVTYEKSDDISESTKYADYFISNQQLHWMTRSGVKLDSSEPMQIKAYKGTHLRILLFVKKSDDEGSDFYYMGDMKPCEDGFHQTMQPAGNGTTKPIVNINFDLDVPVNDNLYKYLHEGIEAEKKEDPITEEKVYLKSIEP